MAEKIVVVRESYPVKTVEREKVVVVKDDQKIEVRSPGKISVQPNPYKVQLGGQGIKGTGGNPGLSAYEVAVVEGFIGTEAEWLQSLEGANGAPGTNGTNGAPGTTIFLELQGILLGSFAGKNQQILRVNAGETGIESFSPTTDFLAQYIAKTPATLSRNLVQSSGDFPALVLRKYAGQNEHIFKVQENDNKNYLYVDKDGHTHIGIKDPGTGGNNTNSEGQRLYFDGHLTNNGINFVDRSAYLECVNAGEPGAGENILRFVTNGSTQLELGRAGAVVFNNGVQTGSILISGNGARGVNGGHLVFRGEFNYVQLQGEKNTVGEYDIRLLGKNPFGGASLSRLIGVFNDTLLKAYFGKDGEIYGNSFIAAGDLGAGIAGTNMFTGIAGTPGADPGWAGAGMTAPNGYIKGYRGTQAIVIPYWHI